MAKGAYIGVSDKARKIKAGYVGVGGVAKKIKAGYVGVGGVARSCWSGTDPVFANNTWEQIISACQSGGVPDTWVVGDQKAMTINGADYNIDIIGKGHDTYTAGGTAPLTFQMHDCYGTAYVMHNKADNNWSTSTMRTSTLPSILSKMPSAVASAVKAVNKQYYSGGYGVRQTCSDKLFLLAISEVGLEPQYQLFGYEGPVYEYYSLGNSAIKGERYWTRSPLLDDNSNYFYIKTSSSSGGASSGTGNVNSLHIAPAFCF